MKSKLTFICIIISSIMASGCKDSKLGTYSLDEIRNFRNWNELDEIEYLRLAASIKSLDSIFQKQDTTFHIFKQLTQLGISTPVILKEHEPNLNEVDKRKQINSIKKYKWSTQECYRISRSHFSTVDTTKSTIGKEVRKRIKEINKASR